MQYVLYNNLFDIQMCGRYTKSAIVKGAIECESRNGRVWLLVPFGTAMFVMFICSENREDL